MSSDSSYCVGGIDRDRALHSESMGNLLSQVMATNQVTTTISQELVLLRQSSPSHPGQSFPGLTTTVETCTKTRRKPSRSGMRSTWTRTPLGTIMIRRPFSTESFDDDGLFCTNSRTDDETLGSSCRHFSPAVSNSDTPQFGVMFRERLGHIQ